MVSWSSTIWCTLSQADTLLQDNKLFIISITLYDLLVLLFNVSELDTIRGNTIENWGCLFVYIYVWTYISFYTLTLTFFVLAKRLHPSHIPLKQNP